AMSDALKKRKSKVLRSETGTPEGKCGRGEGDQCAEVEEKRMQSCIHFMSLKKLNRLAHMRLKRGRDQTHEGKQRVDVLHLQLQNLLYEVMHLQKEISKCLEFKSKHEEIDLVSVDEFYKEAPPEISRTPLTKDDPHQLTLARLDWELEQRKRLAEQYKESLSSKEKIQKGIEVKKEHLSSLQPGLNAIMQASLPVQEYLSMPFEQTQRQTEIARHLPPSLYVLLVQASAYGQACDKSLSVSISGDVDEAKALSKPPEDSQDDDSCDSDAEEEQEKTKRRRPTTGGQLDDKRREMLKRHPLSLCLDLKCKDGSVLHLFNYYLMNLNIMTVKAKVSTATDLTGAISAGYLLNPDTLLNCLYANDQGRETPNPSNRYQFDKVGISSFGDYVAELGHPYLWVQSLGGLQFPSDAPEVCVGSSLSASHMESTMKLLRGRVQSRLALHKQFSSLEHSIVPVSTECQHLFPAKVLSRLARWTTMSHQEYTVRHAQPLVLFHLYAIEEYTGTRLQAAVVLNPRYPEISPLFALSLSWKGECSGRTDDNLRAMESEVNVFKSELQGPRPGHQLLTNQVARLCVCLDVYLETDGQDDSVEGPREFLREKMCLRTVRGPNRLKPFKYNHPQGFFSHR
uniref:THO complex 5 n=1 Tax=Hucho hucho TaxID=62062 RepID=A0A4W5M2V7_9TELE